MKSNQKVAKPPAPVDESDDSESDSVEGNYA